MFRFLVLAGQEKAYATYLRDVVTPIDDAAHRDDVFVKLVTLVPEGEAAWNHGRIFLFRDVAQRDGFAARIAAHAATFDGSADATARRKAQAESLRRLIGVSDYTLED
jgi:hypothetical protein